MTARFRRISRRLNVESRQSQPKVGNFANRALSELLSSRSGAQWNTNVPMHKRKHKLARKTNAEWKPNPTTNCTVLSLCAVRCKKNVPSSSRGVASFSPRRRVVLLHHLPVPSRLFLFANQMPQVEYSHWVKSAKFRVHKVVFYSVGLPFIFH